MSFQAMPEGIRNNNPGNLRSAYGMKYPTKLDPHGFAIYQTMGDGVQSLASLTFDFYVHHGLRTLPDFLSRYAPSTENDIGLYIQNMLKIMGQPYVGSDSRDQRLDRSYNALVFMRAIVIVENGHPPSGWVPEAEWIDLTTWIAAMNRAARWRVI